MINEVQIEHKSVLECTDLYIEKFSFECKERILGKVLSKGMNKVDVTKDPQEYTIRITTTVTTESAQQELMLVVIGKFKINDDNMSEEQKDDLIKNNAVAIMYPFVRSQIVLLTSQPGMSPIILPPINVADMMKNQ